MTSQTIGDLSFDRLWQTTAEKDRDTTLRLDVFRGRGSLVVFSGKGGGPRFKLPLPPAAGVFFRMLFAPLRKSGPGTQITVPVNDWDGQQRKQIEVGQLTVGFDANNVAYIGLQSSNFPPTRFPMRPGLKYDLSATTEVNGNILALEQFLDSMDGVKFAGFLSNFKFDPSQVRGGSGTNRGGYAGGSGSGSGGNYGGQRPNNAPAQPTNADIEDEIPF
jgi:hypothetical protein